MCSEDERYPEHSAAVLNLSVSLSLLTLVNYELGRGHVVGALRL